MDSKPSRVSYGIGLRFFLRHRYVLLFLAVFVLSCLMVLNQFLTNESAHFQLREDFILLHNHGEARACERLYESLIEALPGASDKMLLDDLQRTTLLVGAKAPDVDNLVWKYYVSVKKELERRSEQRLSRAIQRAAKP